MKKKVIIEKCCSCPYFNRILFKHGEEATCFGRNKVHYLLNNPKDSIPDDCPLETVKEESK